MSEEMLLSSYVGPGGVRSPRMYTRAEIAAARRRNLARGTEIHDSLTGAIFWAGGDCTPAEIRQALADYQLLAAAVEREWDKPWEEASR